MTTQQTINVKVPKSMGLAYVLLILLGQLGIHRFYLGRKGSAIAQLVLTIVGYITLIFAVGGIFLAIVGVWLIVDLFLIPGMVRNAKGDVVQAEIVTPNQQQ